MTFVDKIGELKTHPTRRYGRRALEAVKYIVIHHSAVLGGTTEAHAKYHVDTHGWPGLGYHYVITKVGQVQRTNMLDTLSYHVKGKNTKCLGILLEGDYMVEEFSAAHPQYRAARDLLQALFVVFGEAVRVVGHKDLLPGYTCPGDNLYPYVKDLDRHYRSGPKPPPKSVSVRTGRA